MKLLLATLLFFVGVQLQAQQEMRKYKGIIDNKPCTMQYTIKTVKSKQAGMEDDITYKGFITIGTKKINITGWFEGNTMRFEEIIGGKKKMTMIFDISEVDDEGGDYDFIGKRTINGKEQKIRLKNITPGVKEI
jgi:hypothetical protein